jgi:anti-sigma factor RsiW
MSCARVADRLSEYLDGELERALAEQVRRHLEECAGCARCAAELAVTIPALRALGPGWQDAARRLQDRVE